jgi:peptidoglycan/xylan/chitin deacetylase (PgdA/CDA1 family)
MTGKRDFAARLLCRSGIADMWLRLGPRRILLRLLVYHRVRELPETYQFDPELVSATPGQFSWQMRHVRDHCTPISFGDLARILDGEVAYPRNPIIVTFDDGFDDNYLSAYPILRELGVKATIFVATDYIGSGRAFWFDHVAHALNIAPAGRYRVQQPDGNALEIAVPEAPDDRRALATTVKSALKSLPNDARVDRVGALVRALGVADIVDCADSRPLDWAQVAEMASSGVIEIGSHSNSHAILSRLDPASLATELRMSRERIRQAVGEDCTAIAYPDGGPDSYTDDVVRAVQDAGYRFACTNMGGENHLRHVHAYELRRSPVERYTTRERFLASLAFPRSF